MEHLWEIEHPYYCNLGNYFSHDCFLKYKSWNDFLRESEHEDLDLNLIFRWDWKEGEENLCIDFNGDVNYRNGILYLFYMEQRKGLYRWVEIEVCRAEEDDVKEFLKKRWEHMKFLWEPFSKHLKDVIKDLEGGEQ